MTENTPQPKNFCIHREAAPEAGAKTREALAAEVAAEFGPRDESSFVLAARDAAGGWIGGINGLIHWRWLYVAQFLIAPDWRGQGLGRALLASADSLARESGCIGIYLDTFSPRALDFYRANGFVVSGRIENFPPGAARTYLSKALAFSEIDAGRPSSERSRHSS
jgi:GNAT superfamily N-acetyltransferase